MKVLIGHFSTESNSNIPDKNSIASYDMAFGEEVIDKMQVREVFESAGIGIVPAVYAGAGPSGVIERSAFDYIESCFVDAVRRHLAEIDGIYLFLHGASEVEGLGSGDHHILKALRELVGPYLPVCICCDPHGNLCREYVEATTAIRSFRESPHTDMRQSYRRVAQMLCDILHDRQNIRSVYRKLPLILGGEQSVSADEPVRSINRYMDELEQDPRIRSCSWHVGYIRHDSPVAGCGIVVVPQTEADQGYAEQAADRLAAYVWERRHQFHYTGLTAQPEEALRLALEAADGPAVITDSGDNTTAGATGWNTFILRQVLALPHPEKSFLFASICDPDAYRALSAVKPGEHAHILLGKGYDPLSLAVELEVVLLGRGKVAKTLSVGSGIFTPVGNCATVRLADRPVTVIIADHRQSYAHDEQFALAGVCWTDFDVVVVKQGYIFPDLKEKAGFYVMSLTDGATPQDTAHIPFKRVLRPMYPLDEM